MAESPGIRCPICGGKTHVERTVQERGKVKRYRKCDGCGMTFSTSELPIHVSE